jgi:hypothetical protein
MFIIISIFSLLWTFAFLFMGIADLYKMLGGAVIFFYMLPIIAFLSLKYRELASTVWSVIAIFSGFIIVNYLHSYFMYKYIDIHFFILFYVICTPVYFVLFGFWFLIQSFLKSIHDVQYKEPGDSNVIKFFFGFMSLTITAPMMIVVPLLDYFGNRYDINSMGYEIGMGAAIITYLYFLVQFSSVNNETLNYFAKPFHRYNIDLKKVRKYLLIGACIIIAVSLLDELYYRKHWIIWGETITLFIISNILLFRFGKVIFMPRVTGDERPDNPYLPSVKSAKTIGIFIILFLFLLACLIAKK